MAYRIGFDFGSITSVLDPLNILGTRQDPAKAAQDQIAKVQNQATADQLSMIQKQAIDANQKLTASDAAAKAAADDAAKKLLTASQYTQYQAGQLQQAQANQRLLQTQTQYQQQVQQLQFQMQQQAQQAQAQMEQMRYHEQMRQQAQALQDATDQANYYAQVADQAAQGGYGDGGYSGYSGQPQGGTQWGHIPGDDNPHTQYGVQLSGYW